MKTSCSFCKASSLLCFVLLLLGACIRDPDTSPTPPEEPSSWLLSKIHIAYQSSGQTDWDTGHVINHNYNTQNQLIQRWQFRLGYGEQREEYTYNDKRYIKETRSTARVPEGSGDEQHLLKYHYNTDGRKDKAEKYWSGLTMYQLLDNITYVYKDTVILKIARHINKKETGIERRGPLNTLDTVKYTYDRQGNLLKWEGTYNYVAYPPFEKVSYKIEFIEYDNVPNILSYTNAGAIDLNLEGEPGISPTLMMYAFKIPKNNPLKILYYHDEYPPVLYLNDITYDSTRSKPLQILQQQINTLDTTWTRYRFEYSPPS